MADRITELWEILVPSHDNDGNEFPVSHHHAWDEEVRSRAGGLTIHRRARGQWHDPATGVLYQERMIPVRIAADEATMRSIGELTLTHYDQLAVMLYQVSERAIIMERPAGQS